MSRGPHILPAAALGPEDGRCATLDMMLGALHCPFGTGHMGVTAENVAAEHQISRAAQDAFALESQKRAARAIEEGRFKDQIVPVEVKVKRDMVALRHRRAPQGHHARGARRACDGVQEGRHVTAGNASGINDGAAALVLARADAAEAAGLTAARPGPRLRPCRRAARGHGHRPGPRGAEAAGADGLVGDFDVIESNEAFAAQALAVNKGLGLDPAKVNPNGGAIALGHPVGATARSSPSRRSTSWSGSAGAKALITMCIGGGQGIALAIERP
jgi:acetyl-CoA C-acetyltransferase